MTAPTPEQQWRTASWPTPEAFHETLAYAYFLAVKVPLTKVYFDQVIAVFKTVYTQEFPATFPNDPRFSLRLKYPKPAFDLLFTLCLQAFVQFTNKIHPAFLEQPTTTHRFHTEHSPYAFIFLVNDKSLALSPMAEAAFNALMEPFKRHKHDLIAAGIFDLSDAQPWFTSRDIGYRRRDEPTDPHERRWWNEDRKKWEKEKEQLWKDEPVYHKPLRHAVSAVCPSLLAPTRTRDQFAIPNSA